MATKEIDIPRSPTGINLQAAPDSPTELLQCLRECLDTSLRPWIVIGIGHKYADAPHPFGLLRESWTRPADRGAAKPGDKLAASHSTLMKFAAVRISPLA